MRKNKYQLYFYLWYISVKNINLKKLRTFQTKLRNGLILVAFYVWNTFFTFRRLFSTSMKSSIITVIWCLTCFTTVYLIFFKKMFFWENMKFYATYFHFLLNFMFWYAMITADGGKYLSESPLWGCVLKWCKLKEWTLICQP